MDAINKRRSIRKFQDTYVKDELIDQLIEAAKYAPSAWNEQPWEFLVINDKKIMVEIIKIHQYSTMLMSAPYAILLCGNLHKLKIEGFWQQDCSAATQNILLKAVNLGLGSVWLGIYPDAHRVDGIGKLFDLPEHIMPFSLIALGYAYESNNIKRDLLASDVFLNKWGNRWKH